MGPTRDGRPRGREPRAAAVTGLGRASAAALPGRHGGGAPRVRSGSLLAGSLGHPGKSRGWWSWVCRCGGDRSHFRHEPPESTAPGIYRCGGRGATAGRRSGMAPGRLCTWWKGLSWLGHGGLQRGRLSGSPGWLRAAAEAHTSGSPGSCRLEPCTRRRRASRGPKPGETGELTPEGKVGGEGATTDLQGRPRGKDREVRFRGARSPRSPELGEDGDGSGRFPSAA